MRLSEKKLHPDPMEQFGRWFRAAQRSGIPEPNAMTLATADSAGRVSARMVLLKGADSRGFTFFTNYQSRKGRELAANPRAALVLYWRELNRQIRITGRVSKIKPAESDAYFHTRAIDSRFAAIASPQSAVIASRRVLQQRFEAAKMEVTKGVPARPIHWGGYCVHPDEIEFWQQGPHRLHDRIRYRKTRGAWKVERLAP